jgi:hypothetical protein
MKSFFSLFLGLLFLAFILTFGIHASLMSDFFKLSISKFLLFSYQFNFGITLLFTTTIIFFSKHFKDQIGFVFLAGSAVKLVLFMAMGYFKGFKIDQSTALVFFVPYSACLFVEIFMLLKILKNDQTH